MVNASWEEWERLSLTGSTSICIQKPLQRGVSWKAGLYQRWPKCQHETEVKDNLEVERETIDRRGLGRASLKNCLLRSALYLDGEYAPWLQLVRAWWHERLIADSKGLPLPEGSHLCRLAHHPPPFYLKVTEGTWVCKETTNLCQSSRWHCGCSQW